MILLRNIEVLKVNGNIHEIVTMDNNQLHYNVINENDVLTANPVEIKSEVVHGKRFVRYNHNTGEQVEFVVGCTEEVQGVIGIVFEAFDNMSNMVREYSIENREIKEAIARIKNMDFIERLLFLFKGYYDTQYKRSRI